MSRRADDTREKSGLGDCFEVVIDRAAVERAVASEPEPERIVAAADIFGALADPTRLRMLRALALEPLCVCDLAAVAGVSQSATSHQLRLLRAMNLVTFERRGKRAVYSLADDHVGTLLTVGEEHAAERADGAGR